MEDEVFADRPALVFVFRLPETSCNYFIGNKSYPIPIYATTLYYAIDFDDFLYRISSNLDWLDNDNVDILSTRRHPSHHYGNQLKGTYNTFMGSYHRNYINDGESSLSSAHIQLLHPYISNEEYSASSKFVQNDISKQRDRYAYACMGDYGSLLESNIRQLRLGKIYSILYNWHTVFNSQSTHPMNGPKQMFFGKHKFMDKTFSNVIGTSEGDCRIKNFSTDGPTTYCDDYKCLHRKTCSYYNYDSEVHIADNPDLEIDTAFPTDEEVLVEYARISEENNIHGGELPHPELEQTDPPVEEITIEEQMIIWASQRGGAINIINDERENNG